MVIMGGANTVPVINKKTMFNTQSKIIDQDKRRSKTFNFLLPFN